MYSPTDARGDKGFTMIFVALILIVLMAFTSIVLDLGAGYNLRRQDQSAADTAALAAAQDMPNDALVVSTVKSYVADTLDTTIPNSGWNLCTDDPGALPVRATNNNCISFNSARTRIRVRLPDQNYRTAFGRVVGVNEIRHSAFAIAGIQQVGFGNILPFGIASGAGGADGYACLKSNSNGLTGRPCGSTSGNFGYLDFGYFGNEDIGTAGFDANYRCGNGGQNDRIRNAMAVGVDHTLTVALTNSPTTNADAPDACAAGGTEIPDNAYTRTGTSDMLEFGLITGSGFTDGGLPRLRRVNTVFPSSTVSVKTRTGVDSVPLWEYIPSSIVAGTSPGGRVPESCQRSVWNNLSTLGGSPIPPDVKSHLLTEYSTSANPAMEWGLRLLQRCFAHYMNQPWRDYDEGGNATISPEPRVAPGCATGQACIDPLFIRDTITETPEDLYDIQLTPRFGYVPEYWSSTGSGNSREVFRAFRAVYMQRMTWGTGGSPMPWDPGFAVPSGLKSNDGLRELTGMVFHPNMLPNNLGTSTAPFRVGVNRFIRLVR
jgi:hypothetical protein